MATSGAESRWGPSSRGPGPRCSGSPPPRSARLPPAAAPRGAGLPPAPIRYPRPLLRSSPEAAWTGAAVQGVQDSGLRAHPSRRTGAQGILPVPSADPARDPRAPEGGVTAPGTGGRCTSRSRRPQLAPGSSGGWGLPPRPWGPSAGPAAAGAARSQGPGAAGGGWGSESWGAVGRGCPGSPLQSCSLGGIPGGAAGGREEGRRRAALLADGGGGEGSGWGERGICPGSAGGGGVLRTPPGLQGAGETPALWG